MNIAAVTTDTDLPAAVDGCRDLMAIAFGEVSTVDTFERACRKADRKAAARPRDHRLERLRRLLEDEVSLERAWHELNDVRNRSTPKATIDAVWWAICERGMGALAEPRIADRIANFNEAA